MAEITQLNPPSRIAAAGLAIDEAGGRYLLELGLLVFEQTGAGQTGAGQAGATLPDPRGQMDGAPVLAYAFPTSLPTSVVGFRRGVRYGIR